MQWGQPWGNPWGATVLSVEITSLASSRDTAYTLTWTVESSDPVTALRYRVDGNPLVDVAPGTGSFTAPVTLREGLNTLYVEAEVGAVTAFDVLAVLVQRQSDAAIPRDSLRQLLPLGMRL